MSLYHYEGGGLELLPRDFEPQQKRELPRPLTVDDLLKLHALRQPNSIAYRFLDGGGEKVLEIRYGELDRRVTRVAKRLLGFAAPGDRAVLQLSGLPFVVGFLACVRAGVVAVPTPIVRRNRPTSTHQAIIRDCQARLVLSTAAIRDMLLPSFAAGDADLATIPWLTLEELADAGEPEREHDLPAVTEGTLAFLQYTSGSTGRPKGVMLDHANLLHNQRMIRDACGLSERSRIVGWLPMFHDMGLIGNVLQSLYLGVAGTLMAPETVLQKPLRWLEAIGRYRGTISGGPNFAYDLCVARIAPEVVRTLDLSSWQVAFDGAEPVRKDTLERFAAHFAPAGFRIEAFHPCYGLAEATLRVCGAPPRRLFVVEAAAAPLERNLVARAAEGEETRTFVACGDATGSHDVRVAIVDPVARERAAIGHLGEIWVKGPNVARGYWCNPAATEETFRAFLRDGDGPYLRTGDKGFVVDGQLFVAGRATDMMVLLGRNIYPQDVEFVVQATDAALRTGHGAAFSVDFDGAEQMVIAQEICPTARLRVDPPRLRAKIRHAVAQHFGLSVHEIVLLRPGGVPRTTSGKVRRRACREHFARGDWPAQPLGAAGDAVGCT
jgi:acyl-CoA synthetase (AMP-forming)/AMP-acid ligase II